MTENRKNVTKRVHIGPKYELTGASSVKKRADLENNHEKHPNLDFEAQNYLGEPPGPQINEIMRFEKFKTSILIPML